MKDSKKLTEKSEEEKRRKAFERRKKTQKRRMNADIKERESSLKRTHFF